MVHLIDLQLNCLEEATTDPKLKSVLEKHKDLFKDEQPGLPPVRDEEVVINTNMSAPISRPTYHMSPNELEELQKQLEKLLSKDLIFPSALPWGVPVIFVNKPDGSK